MTSETAGALASCCPSAKDIVLLSGFRDYWVVHCFPSSRAQFPHPLDSAAIVQPVVVDQPAPDNCAGASLSASTVDVHPSPCIEFTPNVFDDLVVTRIVRK